MDIGSISCFFSHVLFTLNNRIYCDDYRDVPYHNEGSKEHNGQQVLHSIPLFFAEFNVGVGWDEITHGN